MILNACTKSKTMVDENICKNCEDKGCRHAGELTTKERLDSRIDAKITEISLLGIKAAKINP